MVNLIKNNMASLLLLFQSTVTSVLLQLILTFNIGITTTVILSLFFLLINFFKIIRVIFLLFSLVLSFLFPHAILVNGLLKHSMVDVVLTSSSSEVIQYYLSIPVSQLVYTTCLSMFYIVAYLLVRKVSFSGVMKKKRLVFIPLLIIVTVLAICKMHKNYYDVTISIVRDYRALNTSALPLPQWEIYEKKQKYNTYIVVIGESMRKDFMSLYGFREKTTPFIDSLPKKFIRNYIATAVNTTLSVPRVLAYSDGNGTLKEENNIITLAKLAGFKTYWISSQGYVGKYNTSASRIANFADYKYFNDWDDYGLLPSIESALKSPEKKIIFVHIVGSHENPCHRLSDYGEKYKTKKGKIIDCYVSTYNKTDDVIKKIFRLLKVSETSYSLAYFSDHALNIVGKEGGFKIYRDDSVRQSYEIPFFISSSDDLVSEEINVTRSAYNFFKYFPTWIGVTTNLTPKGYDIFSDINDNPKVMSYDKKLKPLSSKSEGLTSSDIFN